MKSSIFIAIILLFWGAVFAESKPLNYISEFRKNPNQEIFSTLLRAKVKTEKEAERIALNWLGKNHGLLAEEVLIVSGLYKASRRANVHNGSGWIWEIRVTEFTTMLSGVILVKSKDGAVDGTVLNDGKLSNANNFAIIKQRQKTINQLIANFKKSNDKKYKISVISTLGKLRAIEAIPFLIRNIRYGEHGATAQLYPKGLTYAGKALSEIGSPCIIPMLDVIPKISDAFRVERLTNVLVDIHNHDVTISHLQKKIAKAKDFREKQLYENILKRIITSKQSNIYVTLKGMLCNDFSPQKYIIAHPLICHKNGDYPGGTEIIFVKQSNPKQLVHAVFPKGLEAPKNLKKQINLHGHFQGIQNKKPYTSKTVHKKIPDNYKYFVVKSWEYQK